MSILSTVKQVIQTAERRAVLKWFRSFSYSQLKCMSTYCYIMEYRSQLQEKHDVIIWNGMKREILRGIEAACLARPGMIAGISQVPVNPTKPFRREIKFTPAVVLKTN